MDGVMVMVWVGDAVNVGVIVGVRVTVGLGVNDGSRQMGAESIAPLGLRVSPY